MPAKVELSPVAIFRKCSTKQTTSVDWAGRAANGLSLGREIAALERYTNFAIPHARAGL
jgi:hypothetical protein